MRIATRWVAVAALALGPPGASTSRAAAGAMCGVSATGLDFGNYHGTSPTPTEVTGTIVVTCTAPGQAPVPVAFSVALLGTSPDGARRMASARSSLRYRLYLDPARTVEWGDGSAGTATLDGRGVVSGGSPLRQSFTVYGRLLARQVGVRAGRHVDVVAVLLTYR